MKSLSIITKRNKHVAVLLLSSSLMIILINCSSIKQRDLPEKQGKIIAKVKDKVLYDTDIQHLFKEKLPSDDSIRIVKEYIDKWINQELLFQKALSNLTKDEKNKDKELNEYYQSLVIYEYEKKILIQNLDTTVNEEEITDFYNNNRSQFMLRKCILRGVFFKLRINAPDLQRVRKLYTSRNADDLDILHQYCVGNADFYNMDEKKWYYLDEVSNIIPMNADDCSGLTGRLNEEISDSLYHYFINIFEIKQRGTFAPLEFAREQIITAILYQRKNELIEKIRKDVYNEGVRKKFFKIYEK